jgi:ATP-dependent exoDNAse (exonuclease V) beta subunit
MRQLQDNNISLDTEKHIYSLQDDPAFPFTSVTTYIHKYFEPFNAPVIANKLVRMPKYRGRSVQSFLDEWSEASDMGTAVHAEVEEYIRDTTSPITLPKAIHGVKWIENNIPSHRLMLPEIIIYSKELGIAGTIDLMVYNEETDEYSLVDWKTNKAIYKTAFRGKKGIKGPTRTMPDCNFNQYTLQLSIYRFLLEKYYGIKIAQQCLVHLADDVATTYRCPYEKEIVMEMLGL